MATTLGKAEVTDALRGVQGPGAQHGLVSAKAVEWVSACDGYVGLKIHLPDAAGDEDYRLVSESCAKALARKADTLDTALNSLTIEFVNAAGDVVFTAKSDARSDASDQAATQSQPSAAPQDAGHKPIPGLKPAERGGEDTVGLPGVKRAIAVGAGKGGVGKSSISVNLAVALARKGLSVGIMDGDIYGPSLPTMLGIANDEQQVHQGRLQPHLVHGIKAITIGKLVDPEKPLIWRGPMAHGAFKQLAEQTEWGELDYLIIDLPPGTGDVPLTMAQMLKLTGAVVVCTPQRVAQDDAVRAARMFQQLKVDVLGVVENMSVFLGDDGKEYDIFGRGGAEHMAQRMGLPFLGAVPMTMGLRESGDEGDPSRNFEPDSGDAPAQRLAEALERLAANLVGQADLASMRSGQTRPTLSIS
ncbi:MAG: Mrp/NBP35 family ATP-binding protein [Planctomycetota bacterium]